MGHRRVALEDVVNRQLERWVNAWGYELAGDTRMIRRYLEPVTITLEEFSADNVRMAFTGSVE
jgi:hypothetical protein